MWLMIAGSEITEKAEGENRGSEMSRIFDGSEEGMPGSCKDSCGKCQRLLYNCICLNSNSLLAQTQLNSN